MSRAELWKALGEATDAVQAAGDEYARTPTPTDPERGYGAHWWLATDGSGIFNASGYKGQYIVVAPAWDVVLVRTGDSEPEQRGAVITALAELVRAFPRA